MTEQLSIFISYSRKDSAFVDRLEADLAARNFAPWVDRRQLDPGSGWMREIENAIAKAQVVVVVLSPDAVESQFVEAETLSAFNQKKRIFPLLVRPIDRVPLVLNTIHWTDFTVNPYESALTDFLNALAQIEPVPQLPRKPVSRSIELEQVGPLDLVIPHPAPKPPDPQLRDLFSAGMSRKAKGDLEGTVILWEQILKRDPSFQNGIIKKAITPILDELRPIRVERLRKRADAAATKGEWGQEIGIWEALLVISPQDSYAKERLSVAMTNQQHSWLYEEAGALIDRRDLTGAKEQLRLLYQEAPDYGDPLGYSSRLKFSVRVDRGRSDAAKLEKQISQQTELTRLRSEQKVLESDLDQLEPKLENLVKRLSPNNLSDEFGGVVSIFSFGVVIVAPFILWNSVIMVPVSAHWFSDLLGIALRFIGIICGGMLGGMLFGSIPGAIWVIGRRLYQEKKRHNLNKEIDLRIERLNIIEKRIEELDARTGTGNRELFNLKFPRRRRSQR